MCMKRDVEVTKHRTMNSSKHALRTVIQFLSAEDVSGTDIYSRMCMRRDVEVSERRTMNSSKHALHAVIQFLSAEGVSGTDIYSRMCMSLNNLELQFSDGAVILLVDLRAQLIYHEQVHPTQSLV
ncbi:hypothetical protein AVEN_272210-1 [Araneus ventricosus]|uniref:Uncharacterized protein n=1 Tax=Araneus ventricosus TaxID=182803 RepID=A0A4Y2SHB8_ARAVE|nr:hypothetical protein AVEN_272210-1 [Araneus ventricosus]